MGYHDDSIQDIMDELGALFKGIDVDSIIRLSNVAIQEKDEARLISLLEDLMVRLETKGIYRPDIPRRLLKLLVNGLNLKHEDIFTVLERTEIPDDTIREEEEFLVSCAAITQLGFILLSCLGDEMQVVNAGPHVCIIIDCCTPTSMIFVDFSLDSIRKINVEQNYNQKDNYFYLKHRFSQAV